MDFFTTFLDFFPDFLRLNTSDLDFFPDFFLDFPNFNHVDLDFFPDFFPDFPNLNHLDLDFFPDFFWIFLWKFKKSQILATIAGPRAGVGTSIDQTGKRYGKVGWVLSLKTR